MDSDAEELEEDRTERGLASYSGSQGLKLLQLLHVEGAKRPSTCWLAAFSARLLTFRLSKVPRIPLDLPLNVGEVPDITLTPRAH